MPSRPIPTMNWIIPRLLSILLITSLFLGRNNAKPLKFRNKLSTQDKTVDRSANAHPVLPPGELPADANQAQFVPGLEFPRHEISSPEFNRRDGGMGAAEEKNFDEAPRGANAQEEQVQGARDRQDYEKEDSVKHELKPEQQHEKVRENLEGKRLDHHERRDNPSMNLVDTGKGLEEKHAYNSKESERQEVQYREDERHVDFEERHDSRIAELDHLDKDRDHERERWNNRGQEAGNPREKQNSVEESEGDKRHSNLANKQAVKKPRLSAEAGQADVPAGPQPTVLQTPVPLKDLQPPDHVDGLRMEHDGHLNRDYKKEIILGEHHGEFESDSDPKLPSRLMTIFKSADTDGNGELVQAELRTWILHKVQEHLDDAHRETDRIFEHLDTDQDGFIKWNEFQIHFLLAKGYTREQLDKHAGDLDNMLLDTTERERVLRYKFRWAEADEPPQDNLLTRDELQNFRHPEQSPGMLSRLVRDIVANLDRNGDKIVMEEEFVALPRGAMEMAGGSDQDRAWQEERRREFRDVIDLDGDGMVNEHELKVYVDPHNENHASLEADTLIQLADDNSDGHLSLAEVLDNAELFFGSKAVNAGGNFHDEF